MLLETRLTEVVVYVDRARLTRRGTTKLTTGLHQLEIQHLSARLNPDSVRVVARGTASARLLGTQAQRTFYVETPAEQTRQLEEQVEAAEDELHILGAQVELMMHQRAQLEALASQTSVYATAIAAGEMSLEAQMTLLENLRRRAGELDAEKQTMLARKRAVERRLQQLKQQLDQARSTRPRERYSVLIELEALTPGELIIDLSYVVNGAMWRPLYDLRLSEEAEEPLLEIGYLAEVAQQSGEDWQDVRLTLSTARPFLAAVLPELEPWYVQALPPPSPEAPAGVPPMAKMMDMRGAAPALQAGAREEIVAAEEAHADVVQSAAAVSYLVPGAVSIPPDGAAHKVVMARFSLPPVLDYVSAPSLSPAVYRRARVVNDSPYLLLAGKANLFAGAEFIGATLMELVAPQGEFEIFLGADDRVKVERELARREVDKTLLGGRRRLHYGYEMRLESALPTAATVTLRDQIPVSRHEEIKVRLETAEPRPTKHSELNLLEWELTLLPRQKLAVRFDFSVEFPQTMEVIGLP